MVVSSRASQIITKLNQRESDPDAAHGRGGIILGVDTIQLPAKLRWEDIADFAADPDLADPESSTGLACHILIRFGFVSLRMIQDILVEWVQFSLYLSLYTYLTYY